jgi:hypothetical protein
MPPTTPAPPSTRPPPTPTAAPPPPAQPACWPLRPADRQLRAACRHQLRVTPSHGEDRPLGERAIPWYYPPRPRRLEPPLSERRLAHHNLGYRAIDYGGSPRALDPLAGSIAGHSFFRVEGHLGRPVAEVKAELKS